MYFLKSPLSFLSTVGSKAFDSQPTLTISTHMLYLLLSVCYLRTRRVCIFHENSNYNPVARHHARDLVTDDFTNTKAQAYNKAGIIYLKPKPEKERKMTTCQ
jgi:hypothetical protein